MPKGVACSVSNCAFWGEGNQCGAQAINIEIDKHAHADLSAEFAGGELGADHQDKAEESSATCCHTFQPKDNA
ncbi:protein of unknown function [Paenibacillaceae bacterium GAS479]|nr:protein of unknown function [Paenibacillaceae bacterium GAS479]